MDRAKLALIGAGNIGKRHFKAMSQVEEAELTAIVDTQPEAKAIAEENQVSFFVSTEEMFRTQNRLGYSSAPQLRFTWIRFWPHSKRGRMYWLKNP